MAADVLTKKQKDFCLAYVGAADGNGTHAARLAGYSGKDNALGAIASRNIRLPKIAQEIERLLAFGRVALTQNDVLDLITELALTAPKHADRLRALGMLDGRIAAGSGLPARPLNIRRAELSLDVIEQVRLYLSDGVPPKNVWLALNIGASSWAAWLSKGTELLDAGKGETKPDAAEVLLMTFALTVERSLADSVIANVATVRNAAEHSWQAAAWWLERARPGDFARRSEDTVDVTIRKAVVMIPDNGRVHPPDD